MAPEPSPSATRVDIKTLLRHPEGTDHAILNIYLEYNDILVGKGIGSFNIWMKRANYLYGLERLEEAIIAVDMALAHDKGNTEALFLKGVCLQLLALRESGDGFSGPLGEIPLRLLREAKRAFENVVAVNPHDDEAITYLTNLRCLLYSPTSEPVAAPVQPPSRASPAGVDVPVKDSSPAFKHRGTDADDEPVGAVV